MTVEQYLNRTNKEFVGYGIKAKWFGLIGKLFKSKKYLNKSVYYLDKRWKIMTTLLNE